MIFIFTDPGAHGGISAVNKQEEILFSVRLENGLPPEGFTIAPCLYEDDTPGLQFKIYANSEKFISPCHFGIEIADYKNVEVGRETKSGKIPMVKLVYKAGINTGRIIQWFTHRGVHDMIKVKPREWQTILKGIGGSPKTKAEWYLRKIYHEDILKKHGIIGPRGGYNDGQGDSVCGALHLKNTVRQRKVR